MLIHNYDEYGVYTYSCEAELDPLANSPLIPARATTLDPIATAPPALCVFKEAGWVEVIDDRGIWYLPDNTEVDTKELGGAPVNGSRIKHPPTLDMVKRDKLRVMEIAYNTANTVPIAYMGTTFQADGASQSLIAAVLTASGGNLPAGFQWFDINNLPVTMAFAGLQGLAANILLRGQPLFVKKQTLKAAVRAATTVAEVELVTW